MTPCGHNRNSIRGKEACVVRIDEIPSVLSSGVVDQTVRWQKPVPGILEQPEIDRLREGIRGSADLNRTA